jgi:hypothetical protein
MIMALKYSEPKHSTEFDETEVFKNIQTYCCHTIREAVEHPTNLNVMTNTN